MKLTTAKRKSSSKRVSSRNKKVTKNTISSSSKRFSTRNMIVFMAIFAVVGVVRLYKGFALPVNSYKGIFISNSEVQNLPMSGTAWTSLKAVADSNLGSPQLTSNTNTHGSKVYAVALVYARTGDNAYREKARAAIMSALGTEDATGPDSSTGVLGVSRNVMSYIIAADLINIENMNATDGARFRQWVSDIRFKYLPGGRVHSIVHSNQNFGENFGTMAGASRIAADLYLGDTTDLNEAIAIHKAYADRSAYPTTLLPNGVPNSQGWLATYHYFEKTSESDFPSWGCMTDGRTVSNEFNWVAINPAPCTRQGYADSTLAQTATCDLDGAYVEDVSRDATNKTLCTIPYRSAGSTYQWEALSSISMQAEMLRRAGKENLWSYSNQALKRMSQFTYLRGIWDSGYKENDHIPWLINKVYGTNYPTKPAYFGKMLGFTDWTHAPGSPSQPPPQPDDTTAPTTAITDPQSGATVTGTKSIKANASDAVGVTKVEFLVDNVVKGFSTAAPYSYSWDSTTSTNGSHNLQTRAYDAAGNIGNSAAVTVSVSNSDPSNQPPQPIDTAPPVITIYSPVNNSNVSGSVTLSASSQDNYGVSSMEILIDGEPFAQSTSNTINVTWNTRRKLFRNNHTITFRATDTSGNVSTSTITVTVSSSK